MTIKPPRSARRIKHRYGVLDDFGEVLRWQDFPPLHQKFIKEKLPVPRIADTLKAFAEKHGEAPF